MVCQYQQRVSDGEYEPCDPNLVPDIQVPAIGKIVEVVHFFQVHENVFTAGDVLDEFFGREVVETSLHENGDEDSGEEIS